jgi:hypothetical protein
LWGERRRRRRRRRTKNEETIQWSRTRITGQRARRQAIPDAKLAAGLHGALLKPPIS